MILSFLLLDSTDVRFSFWVAEKASEPRAFITRKPAVLLDKHGRSPAKGLEWGGGGGITQVYCHPQRHRHDYFYLFTVLLPRFDCELPEGRNTFHRVNSLTRLRLLGCWKEGLRDQQTANDRRVCVHAPPLAVVKSTLYDIAINIYKIFLFERWAGSRGGYPWGVGVRGRMEKELHLSGYALWKRSIFIHLHHYTWGNRNPVT